MSGSVTVRLESPEAVGRIDALAKAMDRSRNWVLNRAVEEYLRQQNWQIEKITAGVAAADRGDFASDADVQRVLDKHSGPTPAQSNTPITP